MENAVGPAPADRQRDAVMVLSCWEASVRTLTKREQVHAVVDEWLDELLGDRRTARPRA